VPTTNSVPKLHTVKRTHISVC